MQLNRFKPRRVVNVVIGLTLFWCGILSAFFWTKGGFNFPFLVQLAVCSLAGFVLASMETDGYRASIHKKLGFRPERGLALDHPDAFKCEEQGVTSSIGPVPFHYTPPPRLDAKRLKPGELSDILQSAFPKELLAAPEFVESFMTAIENGPHRKLLQAILEVYAHPAHVNLPAGITRHNGAPLLTHCLRVAALMHHRVRDYSVKNYYVSFNDPEYKLPANDPLLILVGLAHDLGKVNSLIKDNTGRYTGIAANHHKAGCRIMSALPEFWSTELTPHDRYILQSCAVYATDYANSPIIPNTEDAKKVVTVCDRFQSLLDLVIDCDITASQIENGMAYRFDEPAKANSAMEAALDGVKKDSLNESRLDLFEQFSEFLATEAVVNGQGAERNLGFKYVDTSAKPDKHLLFVDEEEFTKCFSSFLRRPEWGSPGSKGSALTIALLPKLDEAGYLVRAKDLANAPAVNALYKVEFYAGEPPQSKLAFKSAFVVDLTNWPHQTRLQQLGTCSTTPKIVGSIFGNKFNSNRRNTGDSELLAELGINTDADAGHTIESLIKVTQEAKRKKKLLDAAKGPTAAEIHRRIRAALACGRISPAMKYRHGEPIPIAKADAFFSSLGIEMKATETPTEAMKAAGILSIRPSKKLLGTFIVILDGTLYSEKYAT